MSDAIYVPGHGNPSARLMVIGEAPGYDEEQKLRPFVGVTGHVVNEMLLRAGISRPEVYCTNVFKYRPPGNNIKLASQTGHTIEEGLDQLRAEIATIRPNAILAIGNLALETLCNVTGITRWRGSILLSHFGGYPVKVIGTIHPSSWMRERGEGGVPYRARAYVQLDFNRAVEESLTPEYQPEEASLSVARNSYEVYQYFHQNEDKLECAVDIEVLKCIPTCISFSFSKHHAISVPLINVGGQFIPHAELAAMWQEIENLFLRPGLRILGQNFKFDHEKLLRPLRFSVPSRIYADTMFAQRVVNPEFPGSLEFIASVYTRVPFYKLEGREFDPRKDSWDRMYLYNAKDASTTFSAWEGLYEDIKELGLEEFFFNFIMELHPFYMEMEHRGLRVDYKKRQELYDKYNTLLFEAELELFQMLGHSINIGSWQQVAKMLFEELRLPKRKHTNEDTIIRLYGSHAKRPEQKRAIELTLNIRRYRLVISALEAAPDYDGRMRTSYRIVGTETGRSSTSVLKPPVRPTQVGRSFHSMSKHGDIGGDFRSQYIPDDGMEAGEVDLSQAEARVVAILGEDYELLELFNTPGFDVHAMTAQWFFGGTIDENKKKEPRHVGKTGRHMSNYDAQPLRIMDEINSSAKRFGIDIHVSRWRAEQIYQIFHSKTPRVREVFHTGVVQALKDNDRTLITPFGRRRQFHDRWGDDLIKEAYAYLPQSTVSDQLKMAALRVKKRLPWLQVVSEDHDAIKWQSRPEQRAEIIAVVKEEMERPIDFSRCSIPRGSLVIPCEIMFGSNFKDLKKVA